MTAIDPLDLPMEDEDADPAIVRLGHHAIGLWRAAEDLGDERLLNALRPLVIDLGKIIAIDIMSHRRADDTEQ